jgi:hypothetical protein
MAKPNSSIAITPGSGAVIAAHAIDGKTYQVVIPAGPDGHLADSAETWIAWANDVSFDNAANVSHFSILNGNTEGKILKLHKLFVVPLKFNCDHRNNDSLRCPPDNRTFERDRPHSGKIRFVERIPSV